jgi:hypothetical protein
MDHLWECGSSATREQTLLTKRGGQPVNKLALVEKRNTDPTPARSRRGGLKELSTGVYCLAGEYAVGADEQLVDAARMGVVAGAGC